MLTSWAAQASLEFAQEIEQSSRWKEFCTGMPSGSAKKLNEISEEGTWSRAGMIRRMSQRGPLMVGLMRVGTSLGGSMSQNMIGTPMKRRVSKKVMLEV